MERNLVKHGESTLMISVPANWIKRHNLDKGDALRIQDEGDSLLLTTKDAVEKKTLRSIIFNKPTTKPYYEEIRSTLSKLYREGVDEIIVRYDGASVFKIIHEVVSNLLGYEITYQTSGQCTIKKIIKEFDLDNKNILKRIFMVVDSIFDITKKALIGEEDSAVDEMRLLRDEAWKFRNALFLLARNDPLKTSFNEIYKAHIIELNASYLHLMIAKYSEKQMPAVTTAFLQLFEAIHDYFVESTARSNSNDKSYYAYMYETRAALLERCATIAHKGGNEAVLVGYLELLIQNIHIPKTVSGK